MQLGGLTRCWTAGDIISFVARGTGGSILPVVLPHTRLTFRAGSTVAAVGLRRFEMIAKHT